MSPSDLNKIAAKLPLSKSTLARNPHLELPVGSVVYTPVIGGPPKKTVVKRIRQDAKPLLNKLESEFLQSLQRHHPYAKIWSQALRWKLGNGIWYKPDFVAFVSDYLFLGAPTKTTMLTCWEVKGPHAFRGGFENLKVAASLYPEIKWELVWKEQGEWKMQTVLP